MIPMWTPSPEERQRMSFPVGYLPPMDVRLQGALAAFIRFILMITVLALVLVGASMLPGAIGDKVGDFLSSINPFEEETVDRSGPSVLRSLTELSEFRAASAYYETVVDIENDTDNLPDFLSGERVLYVGKGDVETFVDFGELDERRVIVDEDRKSVSVTLPAPTVGKPVLDLENSYVYDLDEGIVTRFQESDLERTAQLKAVEQMTAAAASEDKLMSMAKESTTATLRGLLSALGYQDITITFDL